MAILYILYPQACAPACRSSGLEGRAYAAAEQFWRVAGRGVAWAMAEVQQMQLGASPAALLNKPLRVLPEDEILKGFAPFAEAYQGLAPPRLNQAQPTQVGYRFLHLVLQA